MIDEEMFQAMEKVLGLLLEGAELDVVDNELAETQRIEVILTTGAATTLSNDQTKDFTIEQWGAVLGQLIRATRLFCLSLAIDDEELSEVHNQEEGQAYLETLLNLMGEGPEQSDKQSKPWKRQKDSSGTIGAKFKKLIRWGKDDTDTTPDAGSTYR